MSLFTHYKQFDSVCYLSFRVENSENTSKYEKRPFTCHNCQYKATKWNLLQKHFELKCSIKPPTQYKCDECPYTSIRLRNVKRHKFRHGDIKPFVCGMCDKGFIDKAYLKVHMLKHQPGMWSKVTVMCVTSIGS